MKKEEVIKDTPALVKENATGKAKLKEIWKELRILSLIVESEEPQRDQECFEQKPRNGRAKISV